MDVTPYITDVPDFPKKGVVFKDISPLLREKFPELINYLHSLISWDNVDCIVGIESRGFIIGGALAQRANVGFVPMRKSGKLPPPIVAQSYSLEYGTDTLEIKLNHTSSQVLLVDDILATGGTLKAAMKLCQQARYNIWDILVIINLRFLNKMVEKGVSIKSALEIN